MIYLPQNTCRNRAFFDILWSTLFKRMIYLNFSNLAFFCFTFSFLLCFFLFLSSFSSSCSSLTFLFVVLVTKTPREDFFRKVLPQKIYFGVFVSCSASCQGTYRPSHEKKTSWRITDPFWRRIILDIRNKQMLRLHAHPPRQTPSAQRKRFSARCICTQTLWGNLLCFARRGVVVCCEEMLLGLDLWWGFFGGIFWWDFFRAFSEGKQPKKSAKKICTPKSAQDIAKSAKKSAPQNPHPKIRTQKSAPKNPHQKIRMKNPHPHVRAKVPTTPMSETNSSKPVPEKVVDSVPHMASYLWCLETATPVLYRPPHPNQ